MSIYTIHRIHNCTQTTDMEEPIILHFHPYLQEHTT